jgi:hypothetical protein
MENPANALLPPFLMRAKHYQNHWSHTGKRKNANERKETITRSEMTPQAL